MEYCTAITETYKFINQYGVLAYEVDKANIFLDGIKNQNQSIRMEITICRSYPSLSRKLEKSTTYMYKEVGRIHPNYNTGDRKGRTRHIDGIGRGQGG